MTIFPKVDFKIKIKSVKTKMTRTKLTISSVGALLLPVLAFAQPAVNIGSLQQLVSSLENLIWIVFGLIVVIAFVTAGILFLTSSGQAEKIQTARSAFLWGVAGVIVGILAYSIVAIISSIL